MWTRGSKANGFKVEVFGFDGELVASKSDFANHLEAEEWGQAQERALHFPPTASAEELAIELAEIDALLADLKS